MQNIDQPGAFYLGREHDLATGRTGSKALLYDSRDLTTHAVCVGMTGSGKTGLCLSLLEEAALDGVPAIAIDPKGDLGNLLLAFPNLEPGDFLPWIDSATARRQGLTEQQFSEQTASLWKQGLAEWGEDGTRIRRYQNAVEKTIYTPGSHSGMPLTILKSFRAPSDAVLDDSEAFLDRVGATTAGLLTLLGIDADPLRSREHILLANLFDRSWRAGHDLDLPRLIREIQKPSFDRVGVVDLETFYPAADRLKLGMRLNNLLASPSFAGWLEGEPLDVGKLLYTSAGQPRLSIVSIAHLNDAERMFFVTILLNEILSWMRGQPGTSSLRALLYMDEVYGYFPPTANPPTKKPMLTLLKQARAYGLGCVLATQNPVDLDYKGLANAGTWLLGRLQTERDKARVLEGLEGATAQAGAAFDRGRMEQTLASLENRLFLMHNVHEKAPVTFHTRWAMSYLRGPLTRGQIHALMAPRKEALGKAGHGKGVHGTSRGIGAGQSVETGRDGTQRPGAETTPGVAITGGVDASGPASARELERSHFHQRPLLVPGIRQKFWLPMAGFSGNDRLLYRPALLGTGKLHFVRASYHLDHWREVAVLQPIDGKLPEPVWESAQAIAAMPELQDDPRALPAVHGVEHQEPEYDRLASALALEKNYKGWRIDLKNRLYRTESCILWRCEELGAYSLPDEAEDAFRLRITQQAREKRDAAKLAVREKYKKRLDRARQRLRKAEENVNLQRSQFWARAAQLAWTVADTFLNRHRRSRRGASSGARQAMRERGEQTRAELRRENRQADWEDLQNALESELEQIERDYDPTNLQFDRLQLRPRKSDTLVDQVTLVWLPWQIAEDGIQREWEVGSRE